MYNWLKNYFLISRLLYKLCCSVANYCPSCLLVSGFQVPNTNCRKNTQHAAKHLPAIKAGLVAPPKSFTPIAACQLYCGLHTLLAQSLRNLITEAELECFTLNKHGKLHCLYK